jgi:alkylation response protein AidB-like acyl-CoA dehydrogenase
LDLAVKYSKERKAFGQYLHEHQSVAFKLADMETEIQAARLIIHKSCWMKDEDMDINHFSAMAKLKAAEVAMKVTTEAVQIHGGYGYVREYHVERLMREAKLTQIYEGTSEIQKIVISRGLIKE